MVRITIMFSSVYYCTQYAWSNKNDLMNLLETFGFDIKTDRMLIYCPVLTSIMGTIDRETISNSIYDIMSAAKGNTSSIINNSC